MNKMKRGDGIKRKGATLLVIIRLVVMTIVLMTIVMMTIGIMILVIIT